MCVCRILVTITYLLTYLLTYLCVVRSSPELSAASRQLVLRTRDAVPAVNDVMAEGSAQHRVGASVAVRLSGVHRRTSVSGLSVDRLAISLSCHEHFDRL